MWSSGDIFGQSEICLSFGNFDIFTGAGICLFAHVLEADGTMKELRKLADILFGISKVCGTWHKLDASCRRLQSYFCDFSCSQKNELTLSFYLFAEVRFAPHVSAGGSVKFVCKFLHFHSFVVSSSLKLLKFDEIDGVKDFA